MTSLCNKTDGKFTIYSKFLSSRGFDLFLVITFGSSVELQTMVNIETVYYHYYIMTHDQNLLRMHNVSYGQVHFILIYLCIQCKLYLALIRRYTDPEDSF